MRSFGVAFGAVWLSFAIHANALERTPLRAPRDPSPDHEASHRCDRRFTALHPKPTECLETIETDRPHKTDSPKVLEPGHAQMEMGLMEYEIARFGASSDTSLVLMTNIYKLGVVDKIDIEVLHGAGSYAMREGRFRLGTQMTVRSKLNVFGGKDGAFAVTLVPAVVVPLAKGTTEAGGFVFMGGALPASFEIELNVGGVTEKAGASRRQFAAVVTAAITRRLVGPLSGFVEWYNDTTTSNLDTWTATADSGLLLLLGKNLQLDAGTYVRLWGDAPAVTPFLGLSTRL